MRFQISCSICILLLLLLGCNLKKNREIPYYNSPDFTPIFLQNKSDISSKIKHQINDFKFTNQNGKSISQKNIEGKISVTDFIFTSCASICPKMTKNLKIVSKHFIKDTCVVILSLSVTPKIDNIAVLKKYKRKYKISNKNWHFLTGRKSEIYDIARKSFFAGGELGFSKDSSSFLHTEHLILVDRNKRIRGVYNGTLQTDIIQLIRDIEALRNK